LEEVLSDDHVQDGDDHVEDGENTAWNDVDDIHGTSTPLLLKR